MSEQDTRDRILGRVCELLNSAGEMPLDTDLSANTELVSLGLDSLKLIEIVYELETEYNVDADEAALAQLRTVGDLVGMVCQKSQDNHHVPA